MFFAEKDADKNVIDYRAAMDKGMQLVPEGAALEALREDYLAMLEDGLLSTHQPSFEAIISTCTGLQDLINR